MGTTVIFTIITLVLSRSVNGCEDTFEKFFKVAGLRVLFILRPFSTKQTNKQTVPGRLPCVRLEVLPRSKAQLLLDLILWYVHVALLKQGEYITHVMIRTV